MRTAAVTLLGLLAVRPGVAQVTISGQVGLADRRLSDGGAVERQQGLIGGGELAVVASKFRFVLSGLGGRLSAKSAATLDVDFGGLGAEIGIRPTVPLTFTINIAVETYTSALGTQRWVLPRAGFELELPFTGVRGGAYLAGSAFFGPSGNGIVAPSGGVAVRGGARLGSRRVGSFIEYQLERLSFRSAIAREEQRGEIMVGIRLSP